MPKEVWVVQDTVFSSEGEEIWLPYPECPNFIEISNKSNIRSKDRFLPNKLTGGLSHKKGKILKPRKDWMGYMVFKLNMGNSIKKPRKRSRMVGIAFIPNPENKPFINHINGIKDDDRIENLEWVTASENCQHRVHVLNKKPYHLPPVKDGNHPNAKAVLMYDFNGNFIKRYETVKDARKDGNGRNKVADAARGERKSAGGYVWKYEDSIKN